ncbi:MAG: DUF996 domain-containing protein [Candidatus Bathyarchaeota archaeon]|nr:DUF996 domain-containing protein [Candidatus Bathyarchaeota archaeon]
MAIEATILLLLGLIPFVGWGLGVIGIVLLLQATKEFSNYYQDEGIHKNTRMGLKYYSVALIAVGAAIAAMLVSFASAGLFAGATFEFTIGFEIGLIILIGGLITGFVFFVLATTYLRKTFNALAEKSGDTLFKTAGTLLWWGSVFSILLVGLLLILIAWIFAALGFFSMKPRHYSLHNQPNGYTPPTLLYKAY